MTARDDGWAMALDVLRDVGGLVRIDGEPAVCGLPLRLTGGEPSPVQRRAAEEAVAELGLTLEWGQVTSGGTMFGDVQLVTLAKPPSEVAP